MAGGKDYWRGCVTDEGNLGSGLWEENAGASELAP